MIEINRKMNLMSVIIVVLFMGIMAAGCSKKADAQTAKGSTATETAERNADGQYLIGSKIKIYDGDLNPIDAYFTYLPNNPWKNQLTFDNAVILNWPDGAYSEAFLFPRSNITIYDDIIGFFRNSIDKSIEWAATAKKNNVHSLTKQYTDP